MNENNDHEHHWEGQFEEYKNLRAKALEMVKRLDELERNTAVACSAIFVFALSSQTAPNRLAKLVLFILPSLVAVFGGFKYIGLSGYLRNVNDYAANLENQVIGRDGWLKYYYSTHAARCGENYFQWFRKGTWAALIGTCVILSTILCIFQR